MPLKVWFASYWLPTIRIAFAIVDSRRSEQWQIGEFVLTTLHDDLLESHLLRVLHHMGMDRHVPTSKLSSQWHTNSVAGIFQLVILICLNLRFGLCCIVWAWIVVSSLSIIFSWCHGNRGGDVLCDAPSGFKVQPFFFIRFLAVPREPHGGIAAHASLNSNLAGSRAPIGCAIMVDTCSRNAGVWRRQDYVSIWCVNMLLYVLFFNVLMSSQLLTIIIPSEVMDRQSVYSYGIRYFCWCIVWGLHAYDCCLTSKASLVFGPGIFVVCFRQLTTS